MCVVLNNDVNCSVRLYSIGDREMNEYSADGMIQTEETKALAEKPVPVPHCLPQIPHELARD
jgi:hypothetical protein